MKYSFLPCGLFLLVFLLLFSDITRSQDKTISGDSLSSKITLTLSEHFKKYPREQTFLHLNQSLYISGQTIWYAAYCMAYGKASVLSKIVYVQLINKDGAIIHTDILPLTDGIAHGNIDLPDSAKTGWYTIRCLTAWMMNFPQADYFQKAIFIKNAAEAPGTDLSASATKKTKPCQIYFFPEGGDLAIGVVNTVAFKATDGNGYPVDVHGDLVNEHNQIVDKFNSVHDGMGKFELDDVSGNYYARVYFPDTIETIKLPASKSDAPGLRISSIQENLEVKIACTPAVAKAYATCVLAAVQTTGQINTFPLTLKPGTNVFQLRKDQFTTGMVRFTLFAKSGVPIAERIVFINNGDLLSLKLKTDSVFVQAGKKSTVNISVSKAAECHSCGNFSVAVTDAEVMPGDSLAETIETYFLLSGELRGPVYHSSWYFSGDKTKPELDLVMLTNGWRHFKWDSVGMPVNLKFPVQSHKFLAGKIKNFNNAQFIHDQTRIKLILINQDSSRYIGYILPDSTGGFILRDYTFSGTSKLYLEASDKKNRRVNLAFQIYNSVADSMNTAPVQLYRQARNPLPITDKLIEGARQEFALSDLSRGILLKTINVKSQKINPTDQIIREHVHGGFESITSYTLDLVNYPFADIGVIEYIKGRFPGLQITEDQTGVYFLYHGINTFQRPSRPAKSAMTNDTASFYPYFYIDEGRVTFDDVNSLSLLNVALIRYMPPPVVFAPYNGGNAGALMIYTKQHSDEANSYQHSEKFDQFFVNGYSVSREFYSPENNPPQQGSAINRPTIYWNPHLKLEDGKIRFTFPNSGSVRKYRIIVQGLTGDGHLAYAEQLFENDKL